MKYHVSVDCQDGYIFPRDYIFRSAQHWGKILSEGNIIFRHHRHMIFNPSRSISVILDGKNELFHQSFMCSMTTTKFGNKTRSLRTEQTNAKLDSLHTFYYDVLFLTTAYSAYAVHFFLGQFPTMELMLLLLSAFFYSFYWIVIFSRLHLVSQYNSVFDQLSMRA